MIILMLRMIILMGQDDGFPTPLHPTPNVVFKKLMGVSSNLFGHGLAPTPPAMGTPSDWERPVNFEKRHLGWGGVGLESHHPDPSQ